MNPTQYNYTSSRSGEVYIEKKNLVHQVQVLNTLLSPHANSYGTVVSKLIHGLLEFLLLNC